MRKRRAGHKPSSVSAGSTEAAIYLGRPLRAGSSSLPGTHSGTDRTDGVNPGPLFGLAPGGVCRAIDLTVDAVSSYLTFSPLPARRGELGLYVFCGTFPGIAPGGRYPPPCPVELGLSSEPY